MKEFIFKVTIAEKIDLPLTASEMRSYPSFEMYMAEYHERLFNVMVKPTIDFKDTDFIEFMIKKLKAKHRTDKVEYLKRINLLT